MEKLREKFLRLLESVHFKHKRFLFDRINRGERLIVIKGQRGTGKTTLMLQHIKEHFSDLEQTLYVSLDDIYFSNGSLSGLVDEFVKDGGKYLYIDEVHRYKNWAQEVKNIYDFYPDLNFVISGSSALDFYLNMADLGRRATVYTLPELSFREYINFRLDLNLKPYALEEIITRHEKIALEINSKIKSLKHFKQYLSSGAYPFSFTVKEMYFEKLEAVINTVIDNDIPSFENITYESRIKIKKVLLMLASGTPFKINFSELARKLGTTRDVLIKYLHLLSQSGILKLLTTEAVGYTLLRKPDKIYLSNSNLLYALAESVDVGTVRETFFFNQVSALKVRYPKKGDFLVGGKYIFEIGGKNKTQKQIAGIKDTFLALDEIEYGHKNRIPLWLFGFLY